MQDWDESLLFFLGNFLRADCGIAVWVPRSAGASLYPMMSAIHREVLLQNDAEPFVHVLLFECPHCQKPTASALPRGERSLEKVDGASLPVHCFCGWSGDLVGINARKHWVEPWENGIPREL